MLFTSPLSQGWDLEWKYLLAQQSRFFKDVFPIAFAKLFFFFSFSFERGVSKETDGGSRGEIAVAGDLFCHSRRRHYAVDGTHCFHVSIYHNTTTPNKKGEENKKSHMPPAALEMSNVSCMECPKTMMGERGIMHGTILLAQVIIHKLFHSDSQGGS